MLAMAALFLLSPLHSVHALQNEIASGLFADAFALCTGDGHAPDSLPTDDGRPGYRCQHCVLAKTVPALLAPVAAAPLPAVVPPKARIVVAASGRPPTAPQHRPSQPRAPPPAA